MVTLGNEQAFVITVRYPAPHNFYNYRYRFYDTLDFYNFYKLLSAPGLRELENLPSSVPRGLRGHSQGQEEVRGRGGPPALRRGRRGAT